MPKAKVVPKW